MFNLYTIITLIVLFSLLSDFYIYFKYVPQGVFRRVFAVKALLMQLSLTGLFFFSPWSLIWLIVLYLTIYLAQFIFMSFTVLDFRHKFTFFALIPSVAVFFVMIYGVTYGRLVSRVEPSEVMTERLPNAFSGYRIVQLSDLHIGNFSTDATILKKMVEQVNALQPDIILFTGDLVNIHTDELPPFMNLLSGLKAKDGIFSVLGNHDYGDYFHWSDRAARDANFKELCDLQAQLGWELLNNRHCVVRRGADSIAIVGVENWGLPPFPQHGDLGKALNGLSEGTFKILLSHNPTHWDAEVLGHTNIDFMFSGHTHAMQMKLAFFGKQYSPSSFMYRQWSGLYKKGNQYLYVNDGFGYAGLPLRVGTRPEITIITLKGLSQNSKFCTT